MLEAVIVCFRVTDGQRLAVRDSDGLVTSSRKPVCLHAVYVKKVGASCVWDTRAHTVGRIDVAEWKDAWNER